MIDGAFLARAFRRNTRLVQQHADGLTHEDSLLQSEHNVNCFNWVLGHIVASRHDILGLIEGGPATDDGRLDRYRRESDPITGDGDDVTRLEDLLSALGRTQETIDDRLGSVDTGWLEEETPVGGDRLASRVAQIHFGYFHDTYHTGQIDLLRQVSGKADKVL
jgi:uncharacterized damage-inducible protein DinB